MADDNPAVTLFRRNLANSHNSLGYLLENAGRLSEAEAEYRKCMDVQQKLADENPAVTQFRNSLALSHNNLGWLWYQTGRALSWRGRAWSEFSRISRLRTVQRLHSFIGVETLEGLRMAPPGEGKDRDQGCAMRKSLLDLCGRAKWIDRDASSAPMIAPKIADVAQTYSSVRGQAPRSRRMTNPQKYTRPKSIGRTGSHAQSLRAGRARSISPGSAGDGR